MTIDELISSVQVKLGVSVDGKAGPETWAAIHTRIVGAPKNVAAMDLAIDVVDQRSEKVIAKLLPEA
jgi:peptidoglycan LD-endopeptidase CwlK